MSAVRVILIGGASHTGKSTLAQVLQRTLGWDCIATDSLARHPGRPWKTMQKPVPPHVANHYLSLSVDELLADVLRHYRNLWPDVCAIIRSYTSDSADGLILEGSALWPEPVATLDLEGIRAVWLTASDSFLQQRIHTTSQFDEATDQERALIEQFLRRTLLYNQCMMEEIHRLGLLSINVEESYSTSSRAAIHLVPNPQNP